MNDCKPLPFPHQVSVIFDDGLDGLIQHYDDAKRRAIEAAHVGQWSVEKAWDIHAASVAEQIVELIKKERAGHD